MPGARLAAARRSLPTPASMPEPDAILPGCAAGGGDNDRGAPRPVAAKGRKEARHGSTLGQMLMGCKGSTAAAAAGSDLALISQQHSKRRRRVSALFGMRSDLARLAADPSSAEAGGPSAANELPEDMEKFVEGVRARVKAEAQRLEADYTYAERQKRLKAQQHSERGSGGGGSGGGGGGVLWRCGWRPISWLLPPVLHPDAPRKVAWDWLVALCVLTSMLSTPLLCGFADGLDRRTMLWLDLGLHGVFVLDVLISCRTAIRRSQQSSAHLSSSQMGAAPRKESALILRPTDILRIYAQTHLLPDVLTALPYSLMHLSAEGLAPTRLATRAPATWFLPVCLLSLAPLPVCVLRLRRLWRIEHVSSRLLSDTGGTQQLYRIILGILYLCHLIGCLYWFVAIVEMRRCIPSSPDAPSSMSPSMSPSVSPSAAPSAAPSASPQHTAHCELLDLWDGKFLPLPVYATFLPEGRTALQGLLDDPASSTAAAQALSGAVAFVGGGGDGGGGDGGGGDGGGGAPLLVAQHTTASSYLCAFVWASLAITGLSIERPTNSLQNVLMLVVAACSLLTTAVLIGSVASVIGQMNHARIAEQVRAGVPLAAATPPHPFVPTLLSHVQIPSAAHPPRYVPTTDSPPGVPSALAPPPLLCALRVPACPLQNQRKAIAAHLEKEHVPKELRRRIDEFYSFLGGVAEARPESDVLPSLPQGLQSQLDIFKKRDLFTMPFFERCTFEQIMDLVPKIERLYTMPGRILIREGRPADGLFMVARGALNIVDAESGEVLAQRITGEFVGDRSLLDDQPAGARVVTAEFCELFLLKREDFLALTARYPDLEGRIRFYAEHKDEATYQTACTKQLKLQRQNTQALRTTSTTSTRASQLGSSSAGGDGESSSNSFRVSERAAARWRTSATRAGVMATMLAASRNSAGGTAPGQGQGGGGGGTPSAAGPASASASAVASVTPGERALRTSECSA